MAKFLMTEVVGTETLTARVSALAADDPTAGDVSLADATERNKFVKLGAESRFVFAAKGDDIETVIDSINTATQDGYSIAGLRQFEVGSSVFKVTFDGSQAAGTGAIAINDYVLVGTVVAKGTSLGGAAPKVCKATDQTVAKAPPFSWRVVSLGTAGTGAVGTIGLIERVG